MAPPQLVPKIYKYASGRKRRISVAPDRPVKPIKSQHLTNYDKLRIIQVIHTRPLGMPVYYVIPQLRELGYKTIVESTLSRLLKDENKIRAYVQSNPQRLSEKNRPILVLPEVDAAVAQWLVQRLSNPRIRVTGETIREKARDFNAMLGYPEDILTFSNGWLERFKIRVGLSRHVFHGEASSAPVERLEDERQRLLSIIALYAPWNVYNVDETALLYLLVPNSGLAFNNMPGVKVDKKRLTYMLCANMDGSDKRPPLIIGRAKQPRCFNHRTAESMDFYYFWNSKAWQVHSIWKVFLAGLNEDMRRQGRSILLLCDNAPSHKHDPAQYPHVRVEFLAPNLTSHIQPMDGGIIASFKVQYKRRFIRLALDRDNQGIEDMYKIDQLQAMYLAKAAWEAVTPQTIANCWRHVGLVPQYHAPPSPPLPPMPNEFLPAAYPAYQPYMDPLPPPALTPETFAPVYPAYQDSDDYAFFHPEAEQAFDRLHLDLVTEDHWTDQEIVAQILQERQDGFTGEEEDDYDLEDYYNYHNLHI